MNISPIFCFLLAATETGFSNANRGIQVKSVKRGTMKKENVSIKRNYMLNRRSVNVITFEFDNELQHF